MEVIVAGVTHRLGPGDAIWFLSSQPHTFVALDGEPCLSVWADTIPDHAQPGGFGSLLGGVATHTNGAPAKRADALAVARELPLDADYLREIVEQLAGVGSSPLGFRTTGTPEDREVAAFVAEQMRAAGLADVAVEQVEVDGWRFEDARLETGDGFTAVGAALGGAPATPRAGVRGRLVDGGGGGRRALDRLDVHGAIVLLDWRKGPAGPSDVGLELGLRGAVGVVVAPAEGGPYFQAEGALGTFDGHWHAGAPPMMTVRMEDAGELRRRLAQGAIEVTLTVRVEVTPGAAGSNVAGYLPGERDGPIVVGAHHDGWFRAAFDNATRRRRDARDRPRAPGHRATSRATGSASPRARPRSSGCSTASSTGASAPGARCT